MRKCANNTDRDLGWVHTSVCRVPCHKVYSGIVEGGSGGRPVAVDEHRRVSESRADGAGGPAGLKVPKAAWRQYRATRDGRLDGSRTEGKRGKAGGGGGWAAGDGGPGEVRSGSGLWADLWIFITVYMRIKLNLKHFDPYFYNLLLINSQLVSNKYTYSFYSEVVQNDGSLFGLHLSEVCIIFIIKVTLISPFWRDFFSYFKFSLKSINRWY